MTRVALKVPRHLAERPGIVRAVAIWRSRRPYRNETSKVSREEANAAADLISLIAHRIARSPETYNQGNWCGTAYCLAGHTLYSLNPDAFRGLAESITSRSAYADEGLDGVFGFDWVDRTQLALLAPHSAFDPSAKPTDYRITPSQALNRIAREFRDGLAHPRTLGEAYEIWERHWL